MTNDTAPTHNLDVQRDLDCTELRGLQFSGIHGVLESEKLQPQAFEVDIEAYFDASIAGKSDRLEDTVSYCDLIEVVRSVVEDESYNLMEAMAQRIAEQILRNKEIKRVRVGVSKLDPPIAEKLRSVTIRVVRP